MKVLMVSALWPPRVLGGAEIYAARLADHLTTAGHEVGALTFGVDGPDVVGAVAAWPYPLDRFAEQPPWRRIAFRAVDIYNPSAHRTMRRVLETYRPDVVHTHSVAGLSTSVLMEGSRGPAGHCHTLHDYWLLCRRTTFVKASGESCARVCTSCRAISTFRSGLLRGTAPDVVIAPSNAIAEHHRRFSWAQDRIRRLDHPVDEHQPRGRTAPDTGSPITFGYVGQITKPKGILTLLRAFRELAAAGHRLVVAGQGPLLDDVRNAGAGVTAVGWLEVAQLDELYGEIDCLVVPSEWPENAPLVVLEARARSIPVIASRAGGLPEIVEERSRPLLFDQGDAAGLRQSMLTFARSPGCFAPGATSGLSWEEHTNAIVGFYEEAAAAKRAQP